jgi:hypothetical protein
VRADRGFFRTARAGGGFLDGASPDGLRVRDEEGCEVGADVVEMFLAEGSGPESFDCDLSDGGFLAEDADGRDSL